MWTVLIIVSGIVLTAFFPSLFAYMAQQKPKNAVELENKVKQMEQRIGMLEERIEGKEERIGQLESEISFINKLLDDKTGR